MKKDRIIYLDVLRVLACSMIVLMHSPHPKAGNSGALLVPLSFITAAGIGIFFMVSGALLLPIKTDMASFLKKRFGKIIGPLLLWTLFYLGVSVIMGEKPVSSIPHALASIPFSVQGHGVLWFMYTLAGLYLVAPIISPFLAKSTARELCFFLILWVVTLCFPLLKEILDVNNSSTGILFYFSGYVGYFILGYYIHTYKPYIPKILYLGLFFIPILCLLAFKYFCDKDGGLYDYFWYLSIFVVMMCVAWFEGVRNFPFIDKMGGAILVELSNCSFGIYLMHIFVMHRILWNIDFIVYGVGGIGQLFMTWTLTFIISFLLTYMISYLPYSEYIVGYRKNRK